MIVQCPSCETKFRIADTKIAGSGVKVRCSKCAQVFVVRKDQAAASLESIAAGTAVSVPPAPSPPTAATPADRRPSGSGDLKSRLEGPKDPFAFEEVAAGPPGVAPEEQPTQGLGEATGYDATLVRPSSLPPPNLSGPAAGIPEAPTAMGAPPPRPRPPSIPQPPVEDADLGWDAISGSGGPPGALDFGSTEPPRGTPPKFDLGDPFADDPPTGSGSEPAARFGPGPLPDPFADVPPRFGPAPGSEPLTGDDGFGPPPLPPNGDDGSVRFPAPPALTEGSPGGVNAFDGEAQGPFAAFDAQDPFDHDPFVDADDPGGPSPFEQPPTSADLRPDPTGPEPPRATGTPIALGRISPMRVSVPDAADRRVDPKLAKGPVPVTELKWPPLIGLALGLALAVLWIRPGGLGWDDAPWSAPGGPDVRTVDLRARPYALDLDRPLWIVSGRAETRGAAYPGGLQARVRVRAGPTLVADLEVPVGVVPPVAVIAQGPEAVERYWQGRARPAIGAASETPFMAVVPPLSVPPESLSIEVEYRPAPGSAPAAPAPAAPDPSDVDSTTVGS